MSCNDDFLAIRPRKQLLLLDSSSQRAGPSTRRTRHPRICSSTSLPPYSSSPPADLDNPLDPLDDITLDSDLGQRSASSATLPSRSVSSSMSTNLLLADATCASSEFELPARSTESRQLYPLREPGQLTAQRTQRLRARTAAVITSLPATLEEVIDEDEHESHKPVEAVMPGARGPKLRRVSGVKDLRRAFRDGDHAAVHFASISSLGDSKASYELGFLASPTSPSPLPHLSLRSSSRTLVDSGSLRPQSPSDLKTLCGSTFSSLSVASRFAIKAHPTLASSRPSHARSPSESSQSMFSKKRIVPSSLTPRAHRHASLQLDNPPLGEVVWSCAKISQSALKRTARRGHAPPRRVFSSPIAALAHDCT